MSPSRLARLVGLAGGLVLAVPLAAAGGETEPPARRLVIEASGGGRVRPWRASSVQEGWHGPLSAPARAPHSLWPPETLERVKRELFVSPDLPAGREVPHALVDPAQRILSVPPSAPTRKKSFDGLDADAAGFGPFTFFPPDSSVAVGPTRVLETANVAVRMTNRRGRRPETMPLNLLFDELGTLFDPKVYFDPMSGRFFIVALLFDDSPRDSAIYLAVSRSSAPQGLSAPEDFCTYRIRAKRGRSWADYPGLGVNERWLAVAVNNFTFGAGRFKASFVYVLDVAELTAEGEECPTVGVKRFRAKRDPDGFPAFTLQPARHDGASGLPGQPLFLVSSQLSLGERRRYTVWRVVEGATGAPRLEAEAVEGEGGYTVPPPAEQQGGTAVDSGDQRVMQAVYGGGDLWAVHASGCSLGPLPNESCVRAVRFEPTADGAPVTFEETYGTQDLFYFWPGLAMNGRRDVAAAFQAASADGFLGVSFNGKRRSAPGFDAVRTLRSGSCPLDDFDAQLGAVRSGDFVGAHADPRRRRDVWISGEYAGEDAEGLCRWVVRVARLRY